MMVREARRQTRQAANTRPAMRHKTFPAPNGGLVLSDNLADQQPNSASVMINAFPTLRGVRIRGGSELYATIGSAEVESIFAYSVGQTNKIFAAADGKIFDITVVADPEVAPTAAITGQTSNDYTTTPFTTSGGNYLYAVNGDDDPQLFDGTSWQAVNSGSSPISVTGVTTANLSHVVGYKNRLFFVEKDTLKFWYLPVSSIGGAATSFSLDGVFKRGGSLLFGATWSQDAGDGLDDKIVFVTTLGEVAIYEGSNPSDVNDWNLVGVYEITPPLGKNAHTRAGGDLVIMTQAGMVPISEAVSKEASLLGLSAISRPIEPLWKDEVARRPLPWQIIEIPKLNMGVVSLPSTGDLEKNCLVVNLQTSRWGLYIGWDTRSVCEFGGDGYFGTSDGKILKMEKGGTDNGQPYVYQIALAADHCGSPGVSKTYKMGRSTFKTYPNLKPQVSVSVNYDSTFPPAPNAGLDTGDETLWDSALWDSGVWDGGVAQIAQTKWQAIGRTGFTVSPQVQGTISNSIKPKAELISIDLSWVDGGLHVT